MKRERMLQVFVGLLGIVYLSLIYPLYADLWHFKWKAISNGSGKTQLASYGGPIS